MSPCLSLAPFAWGQTANSMKSELVELDRISDYPSYWAPRYPDREAMVLGAAGIGALFTGLNLRFQYEELHFVVDDAKPRLLVFLPEFAGRDYRPDVRRLLAENPSVEQAITLGTGEPSLAKSFSDFLKAAPEAPDGAGTAATAPAHPLDPFPSL